MGRAKIRQIISQGNCPFTVNNGTQICVIREAFIDYLDKQFRI
ncbi:MAG: excisionase [Ruminococcus sp.]